MLNRFFKIRIYLFFVFFVSTDVSADTGHNGDVHYTDVGFFDIHVCNWPDRPLFLLAVFSSYAYDRLEQVEILTPDGAVLGGIQLKKYRLITKPGKAEKRAFIQHLDIPEGAKDGWYRARIRLKDQTVVEASDYLRIEKLPLVTLTSPAQNEENVSPDTALSWEPVPGARFYQVFLRDMWDDGKVIFETDAITENKVKLPPGLLEAGGLYTWRIHARDVNDDPKSGDFNHGSLTGVLGFSTGEN